MTLFGMEHLIIKMYENGYLNNYHLVSVGGFFLMCANSLGCDIRIILTVQWKLNGKQLCATLFVFNKSK